MSLQQRRVILKSGLEDMGSSKPNPNERVRESIQSFCQALSGRDFNGLQSLLADDATLNWGPYTFRGKEQVLKWAKDLFELFPFMSLQEKSLTVQGDSAKHDFIMAFLTSDRQRGGLPCTAEYDFEDGYIRKITVNLLNGFLFINRSDLNNK